MSISDSALKRITDRFRILEEPEIGTFNVLGNSEKGNIHLVFFESLPRKEILRVDSESPVNISPECIQYYVYNKRTLIGSVFNVRKRHTTICPYMVTIVRNKNFDYSFNCVNLTNTKSSLYIYKDSQSNVLLASSKLDYSKYLILDNKY